MLAIIIDSKEDAGMDMSKVHSIAESLVELHGLKAEVEVARKIRETEKAGDTDGARDWQRIRAAIREMKSSHVS